MPQAQPARLAEVLAALSLATDLGAAWPPETALKTCLVGVELARRVGLAEPEVADVYFLALLRSVACTSFAHEMTRAWGDDIEARRLLDPVDKADPDGLLSVARALEQDQGRERGARAAAHLLSPAGVAVADQMCLAHRDVGRRFATRLGLGEAVGDGLGQGYERWDGNGMPGPLSGEEIPHIVRVVHVAYVAEAAFREGGPAMAVDQVRRRSGGHFDPAVAAALVEDPGGVLAPIASESVWDPLLDAEPEPWRWVDPSRLDTVLEAFADFVDLKAPWTLGHSHGVARLAADAGEVAGLDAAACGSSTGRGWSTTWDASASPTPSGTSAGACPMPSGSACACTRTTPNGCSARPDCWPRSAAWWACTTSARTGPATADAYQALGQERPASCARPSPRAGSTATPPARCWSPPGSGRPASAGPGHAGSPTGRSRSCGWSPEAARPGRSRPSW